MDLATTQYIKWVVSSIEDLQGLVRSLEGSIETALAGASEETEGISKGYISTDSFGVAESSIRNTLYNSVGRIAHLIESRKMFMRDNILGEYQRTAEKKLTPKQILNIRAKIESNEIDPYGKTLRDRVDLGRDMAYRDIGNDLLRTRFKNVKEKIRQRLLKDTDVRGISYPRWSKRLLVAEIQRTAQLTLLYALHEQGVEWYSWNLSSRHYEVWKKYKKYVPGQEICEIRSENSPYTYEEMKKYLPAHVSCACMPSMFKY